MLMLLGCAACMVAGFVLGLMYAKKVKDALSSNVDS